MQKDKIRTYFTPKRIAYLGIMVAISVVTNAFTITIAAFGANSISFNYVVCSLAGIFFGPISGGIVGILGDLIGCLIAFAVGATVSTVSQGLQYGWNWNQRR